MGARVLGGADADLAVGRIYEATADPQKWGRALDAICDLLDAEGVLLVYCNHSSRRLCVVEAVGFNPSALVEYEANHIEDDELIRESMDGPAGIVVSSARTFRGKPFRRSAAFRRLLQPSGFAYIAGAAALNTPEVYASLWMARSEEKPDFSIHDVHIFVSLLPHVTRAMTVHHRIRQAELQAEMAVGAFDRVAVGVVLVDAKGRPVLVNREAERIASKNDGFVLLDDRVAAGRSGETEALRNLVRRVDGGKPKKELVGGGAIRISRPSGSPHYHVVVLPLPRKCQPADGKRATSVLFITDPEKTQCPVDYLFGDLYGLTNAEVRLVTRLLEGGGLTAAAQKLGLSRNTVHSQLASVFQKTGTKSQSELLTLLLTSVAPVEPPDETSGFDMEAFEPPPPH